MPSGWTDVVENFVAITEDYDSPLIFRTFSGISLVAGALERRVWTRTKGRRITYPNLYVMLVGEPGSGKQIINEVEDLWTGAKNGVGPAFHVVQTSVTRAALIDSLNDAKLDHIILGADPAFTYASLLIPAEEFGVFIRSYDTEMLETLCKIYNNPPSHTERRRTGSVKDVSIQNPQFNIIGAEQPGRLASIYPEDFWTAGFASRTIMVYSEPPKPTDLFHGIEDDVVESDPEKESILLQLEHVARLYGVMKWHPDAMVAFNDWHKDPNKKSPNHSKLVPYLARRTQHATKLIMVAAVSRTGDLKIDPEDVVQGIKWLYLAEETMPSIFMAMKSGSDKEILDLLYEYIYRIYRNTKHPVDKKLMTEFLVRRVPVERITRLIDTAEQAGYFERIGGTETYIPRSTLEHKLE